MKKWLKILLIILGIVLFLIIGYIIVGLIYSYFNSSQYQCWKIGGTWEKDQTKLFCGKLTDESQCWKNNCSISFKKSTGITENFILDKCRTPVYCNCPQEYQMQYNFCKGYIRPKNRIVN